MIATIVLELVNQARIEENHRIIMEQQMYCVFDNKAAAYLPPFTQANDALAIRVFANAVAQEGHDFNTHAEDFTLWNVGTFDPVSALVKNNDHAQQIVSAHEVKAQIAVSEESNRNYLQAIQGGE